MTSSVLTFNSAGVPLHDKAYKLRRFLNWFPLGLGYASLYFMRYNLNAAKSAFGDELMTVSEFSTIFGAGAITYFLGFLVNSPIIDRKGGRWGMLYGLSGAMICNLLMGVVIWGITVMNWQLSIFWTYAVLYSMNMFFQSCGAVSIVTTKMPWFHVRERGTFSTIFGVMISLGVYFAFDWSFAIAGATRASIDPEKMGLLSTVFATAFGTGGSGVDENWWLFYFPALFGAVWLLIMAFSLRNKPSDAGFADFETGDQHISDHILSMKEMFKEIFTNPKNRILMIVCFIEFCSGVVRNGTFQYYPMFGKSVGFYNSFFIGANWGLVLLICGFIGANTTGWVSDKLFSSKRGPMAMFLYVASTFAIVLFLLSLSMNSKESGSWITGAGLIIIAISIIGIHGILSGTAAGDFSGVKNTGKATGIVDGFVYLGTAAQSFLTGFFLPSGDAAKDPANWIAWPIILLPAAVVGWLLSLKIYHALPNKTKQSAPKGDSSSSEKSETVSDSLQVV
jgi:OPA family glycerol-3-phosphate transporter-like MFS transporter